MAGSDLSFVRRPSVIVACILAGLLALLHVVVERAPTAPTGRFVIAAEGPTLFRGTAEGFQGGQGALRAGITPASTDRRVAAAFATYAEQFGEGVMHIASPADLAGLKVELGSGYLPYEAEAFVGTTPADFASRAGLTISSSAARGALSDMGIYVPGQIGTAGDLTAFLRGGPLMSPEEIAEFLTRVGG